jgi:hypothetical protein
VSLNNPIPGQNSIAEYQVSPIPWITASLAPAGGAIVRHDLPFVASTFCVRNCANSTSSYNLAYGFSAAGVTGSHRGVLKPGESISADMRFKTFFVMSLTGAADYELLIGLTGIPARFFPEISNADYPGVG